MLRKLVLESIHSSHVNCLLYFDVKPGTIRLIESLNTSISVCSIFELKILSFERPKVQGIGLEFWKFFIFMAALYMNPKIFKVFIF